jgi:hypothetical protein
MKMNGDCTHKSIDALIVMIEQLARTMMPVLAERVRPAAIEDPLERGEEDKYKR